MNLSKKEVIKEKGHNRINVFNIIKFFIDNGVRIYINIYICTYIFIYASHVLRMCNSYVTGVQRGCNACVTGVYSYILQLCNRCVTSV